MNKKQLLKIIRFISVALLTAAAWILPIDNKPEYVKLLAFAVPYLLAGFDVLMEAAEHILKGKLFDENFLMALATLGALAIGEYPEAVAVMLFYQIGEFFQDWAVDRSRDSISKLIDIRPEHADVIRNGEIVRVLPEEVAVGEIIVVRPGERVPLDGIVTDGSTTLDTSALTGESLPRDVGIGDRAVSGTVNINGLIEIRVTERYSESTVAKILDLVENQAAKKAKTETFIRRFARVYTPIVVVGALALFIVPSLFDGQWSNWLGRALIFLVVSCPCALVVSVPLSFFGGIGGVSRKGILVKGSNYIEALAKMNTVVFDKTGTLTRGIFRVSSIHPRNITKDELLRISAHAEHSSNHPIARSIVEAYEGKLEHDSITSLEELPGMGIKAALNGKSVVCGNAKLMESVGITPDGSDEAGTLVHVAQDGKYVGYIVISDTPKTNVADAIEKLRKLGIKKTVMLTGDLEKVGVKVAGDLGIDEVKCELLPDGKVEALEELLSKSGRPLAYVGDGINDAPVLGRADVGIAMGALGSDAAIEAADVVLMDDDPSKIADAVKVARRTMLIVRQNILFALVIKFLVLILGALGRANMWFAVFADVGVTFICILNAMRALKIK